MMTKTINGAKLSYEVHGNGSLPLLFIHGYAVRASAYRPLYALLADNFTIYSLDTRSHGGSAHVTDNCTVAQWVDDILAFVDAMKIQHPVYVGHSLGGALGLAAALKRDDAFRAICCINPLPASGGGDVSTEVVEAILADHNDRSAMLENYRSMFVRQSSAELIEDCVDAACHVPSGPFELYLKEEMPDFNISAELNRILTPVLILGGMKDGVCSPAAIHETALGLPNCKEVVFSDEGHMMPLESPVRTAAEVIAFTNNL